MTTPARLTYEQFGRAFIDLVVTPDEIAASFDAQLGAAIAIEEKVAAATVTGTATPSACSATRASSGDGLDEITVGVPLAIRLHVSILDILEEDYDVTATVELRLHVETWTPLTIILDADEVTPDDVSLQIATSSWLKLAERLGGLEQQIKSAVCSNFNDRINQSQSARTIDVLSRVRASLKPKA